MIRRRVIGSPRFDTLVRDHFATADYANHPVVTAVKWALEREESFDGYALVSEMTASGPMYAIKTANVAAYPSCVIHFVVEPATSSVRLVAIFGAEPDL